MRSLSRTFPFALLALVLLPLPPARAGDTSAELARSHIAMARRFFQAGDYDRAAISLRAALAVEPDNLEAHQWLAHIYGLKGLLDESLDEHAAVLRLDPQNDFSRREADGILARVLPRSLAEPTPEALKLPEAVHEFSLTDPRLPEGERHPRRTFLTAAARPAEEYCTDPRYGWDFATLRGGYVFDPETHRWQLRFRLHEATRASRALGGRALEAALALHALGQAYLKRESAADHLGIVDIWLCPDGQAGAEAMGRHIYIYRFDLPRSPGEWWRELAHEYGHLVVPGVGGFEPPEAWANGELGERLFTRWALENPALAASVPWTRGLDAGAYFRRQPLPLINEFLVEGPESPRLRGSGQAAMRHFLGLALYVEAAYGPDALRLALDGLRTPTSEGFLRSFESALGRAEQASGKPGIVEVRLDWLGRGTAAWVYIPKGTWTIEPADSSAEASAPTAADTVVGPLWTRWSSAVELLRLRAAPVGTGLSQVR
jgi:tetratricopeptide (TPR) repeat protein